MGLRRLVQVFAPGERGNQIVSKKEPGQEET